MIYGLLKRGLYALLILLSIASIVFFLFSKSFPDPEQMVVGERTDKATSEAIKKELGLDQSLWHQYISYINDLSPVGFAEGRLTFKTPYLRRSFQNGKPVSAIIKDALPGTIVLAVASMLLATFLGLMFGVLAARFQNRPTDRIILAISTAGISIPGFFAAILVAWFFAYVLHNYTKLPMTGSLYDIDPFNGKTLQLSNLILPTLALGVRPLAVITQLTRSALIEELSKDYIRTARAKGLSEQKVIWRHALRNAINPVITSLSGWFASLLAGAFFVEYIFNWKGLGKVTIDSLEKSDLPVVMGSVLFVAVVFVFINMMVDMIYVFIDPRIRKS
jgi:peptide/nickel transport system permease protein